MEDVQNHCDNRGIPIERVGITDLRYPIVVLDQAQKEQKTIARITVSVEIPHHFKGTHMSRFIEVLERHRGEVTMHTIPEILQDLKEQLEAECAQIEISFPYFMERIAPISGARALMDYECSFVGEANGSTNDFILGIKVPIASLCPCSKAISEYGAHNQRGYITIKVRTILQKSGTPALIWLEELIDVAESAASAPVFPLLKRADERHLTMLAYDNPAFVEDIVRDVAMGLKGDSRVAWFRVRTENQESIHNHNVFAQVTWDRAEMASGKDRTLSPNMEESLGVISHQLNIQLGSQSSR